MRHRILVVGDGGRESALAHNLARSSEVYAFLEHRNPSILAVAANYSIGNPCDPNAVAEYAQQTRTHYALVSDCDLLARGVVDALLDRGIPTVGPTRAAAQIEWDKTVTRELLQEVWPSANPRYAVVRDLNEINAVLAKFADIPVVVKPAGLTQGRGVKVMGPHLADHAEAGKYAAELLTSGPQPRAVVIEEKIDGIEFILQAITDGKTHIFTPATFDYPYRLDGDTGPGTGGMGCYSAGRGPLPFMTQGEYNQACEITSAVLAAWGKRGHNFSGVLCAGFFLTEQGLRVIELNARIGDPEALNIIALLETDLTEIIKHITRQRLSELDLRFRPQTSLSTYLVAPSYPDAGDPVEFDFAPEVAVKHGCKVHFRGCEQIANNRYRIVGTSRILGLVTTSPDLAEAYNRMQRAITKALPKDSPLEWRTDIGSPLYIKKQCNSRNFQLETNMQIFNPQT